MEKIVYVDMDDTLVDFESSFARLAPGVNDSYAAYLKERA